MKRYKKEDDVSYTLGASLTFQLLETRPELAREVYMHPSMDAGETGERVRALCAGLRLPLVVSPKPLAVLSDNENCYLAARFAKFCEPLSVDGDHVVLVCPSNAGNLGTILRSCLGFGYRDLAIIRPAADIFDPKTVRASMGAVFGVRAMYFDSFDEYRAARPRAFYPLMLRARQSLDQTVFEHPHALIFGNEATGLPPSFLDTGTPVVIRHGADIDSLNLPVAVSIALYEATRGRAF